MRRFPIHLLAMLLLARPQPARASTPALDVPGMVEAGQRLEIRWAGLPETVQEVELELSLDGGRWVRISPELEAREARYHWRVPAVTSARARLRLRAGGRDAGGDFERELTTSAEFRIESREPVAALHGSGLEWWRVGERAAACGWERTRAAATLSEERSAGMAEPDSRSQAHAHAPSGAYASLDRRIASTAPRAASAEPTAARRHPLRL
jgi:hypothetical protein